MMIQMPTSIAPRRIHLHRLAVILTAAFVWGLWPCQVATAQNRPGSPAAGAIVLKMRTLLDPAMSNMPSFSVLVPTGWNVSGGAWWPPQNLMNIMPSQDVTVTAPDGRMVRVGPTLSVVDPRPAQGAGAQRPAEGSTADGLPVIAMPYGVDQWRVFLQQRSIPQNFPNARNISVDQIVIIPELTAILQRKLAPGRQQQQQIDQQWIASGLQRQSTVDGAVLAASCKFEDNGQNYEMLMLFGTGFLAVDTQQGRQIYWGVEPNLTFRAPAGQLQANMPLMLTIANSVQMVPQWEQMKLDHMAKMHQIAAKGTADRSRIIADSGREIGKIITEGYEQRQATMDRTSQNVINSIRGVGDYTTPGSGTSVQLPSQYEHIFASGNGEYILTNDPLYNPNTDQNLSNQNWTPMQPAR